MKHPINNEAIKMIFAQPFKSGFLCRFIFAILLFSGEGKIQGTLKVDVGQKRKDIQFYINKVLFRRSILKA